MSQMTGDWRISADERSKYDSYFQQCGPIQGYLSGEQARDFFFKSNLPGDVLRKIWDLADVTADGRLDRREFAIACHLISSQVQKKAPLPPTLPPSLLSDLSSPTNGLPGMATVPLAMNIPGTGFTANPNLTLISKIPASGTNNQYLTVTAQNRSKYLQQFHALADVAKGNGFMSGLQAKNILQQTGLPHMILHQIWNLADHDKDGRLTPDEFVVAMHCCDIIRAGQVLPSILPDDWLNSNNNQRERTDSLNKVNAGPTFAALNQQLRESINGNNAVEAGNASSTSETSDGEQKPSLLTYEEKRLKNYEDGNRELERRRQMLRDQEEREQREREERERKRELELQKQKDEQDRKKQMEIERQLEKQRQIEQQREEERRKLFEQREAARKELERKNRLEWERQRMQELSSQKSRLLDQINDLKSREKALELELQSMDDTIQTCSTKIEQTNGIIHTIDESLANIQRNIENERSLLETLEQQKRTLSNQSSVLQTERESLEASANQLQQSKEFGMTNRESDLMKSLETQIANAKQETVQIDQQISVNHEKSQEYQTQIDQLRAQLEQLETETKKKKATSPVDTNTNNVPIGFANFDQFNALPPAPQAVTVPTNTFPSVPFAPVETLPNLAVAVDPFQTVDPFATQTDLSSATANTDWFPASQQGASSDAVDPFLPRKEPEPSHLVAAVASPKVKRAAPKANAPLKDSSNRIISADPWGSSNSSSNGHTWAAFNNKETTSTFGSSSEWPHEKNFNQGNSSTASIQYRVLYDYVPERPDEMAISTGDIIIVDPSKQQDEHWLFGQIGDNRKGFFPAAYTELVINAENHERNGSTSHDTPVFDTTSPLSIGSLVITLADYQGKTVDKHLSFVKGETILVRGLKDATWYTGQLHSKVGWFPRNHVRPATEVETQNAKNSTKNTPTSEKSIQSPNATNGDPFIKQNNPNIYEALYAYEATDPSDLSFDIGERILVLKSEGDWWTGRIANRIGTFPNNYVQKFEFTNQAEEKLIAINAYESTEEGHLVFEQNQTITIRVKTEQGWYLGEISLPDQPLRLGWFPSNCVQASTKVATPTSPSTPIQANKPEKNCHYVAIFPYDAQQEDELSFPADATLEILDPTNTTGWFKARLGDQVGLIPATYVQAMDNSHSSSSMPCCSSPTTKSNAAYESKTLTCPFIDDSNVTSTDGSPPSNTDQTFSQPSLNNPGRTAAIRELIETEQRYVHDLKIVANDFIRPLSNGRILNDNDIESLFSNWYSLIAFNSVFLTTLQEQIVSGDVSVTDEISFMPTPRSVSMSNITMISQPNFPTIKNRIQDLFLHQKLPVHTRRRSKIGNLVPNGIYSLEALSDQRCRSIECLQDNLVPHSPYSTSTMTISDTTNVGDILRSYLPFMADAYFQYCNCRSQANKYLQSKMDGNNRFREQLESFQRKTGGLSLHGYLTKPIQRVTRYPLLIEKILKNTPRDHPDYQSVEQAFECARQLNEKINREISVLENSMRLDWLQEHLNFGSDEACSDGYLHDELLKFNSKTKYNIQRQLLLHGPLLKIPSGKELITFLFNDFLLFATIKSSSSNWQSLLFESGSNLQLKLYRMPLLLTDIVTTSESATDQLIFNITTKIHDKPIILRARQTNIRTLWVRALTNAIEQCRTWERSMLEDKSLFSLAEDTHDCRAIRASVNLIVEEAFDLVLPQEKKICHRYLYPYCEITVNSLTFKTSAIKQTTNPKWDTSMRFILNDISQDIININIYDQLYFAPHDNLGTTSIHLCDLISCSVQTLVEQKSMSTTQQIFLNNGVSLSLRCNVHILQI